MNSAENVKLYVDRILSARVYQILLGAQML